ncbi:MAG: hypothetical protein JWQ62_2388 [Lacunisphaera sp.]|nr:hypothetical protein [Lacunisphaera sp.]
MSDYSGYIRGRPRSLGPFTSVYEATAPGGGPGRFALKIFHPPASTQIRRSYDLEGWLLAAERQQIAFKKDGAVLEILAFGRCEEGAYTVTPWQDRPLEPLLTTLTPKGDHLRALAASLLNALEQWNAQTGGSHRKLKASNVFLTKSGPLADTTAVFTDPWFTYGNKTGPARLNDLTAIGAILAEVVRRRPVTAWPIEEGPEWRALGRPGKAWLAYCNYLLNPQPVAGELTLTEARKRLKKVPPDSNPVRTALLIGAAALLVLGGSVVTFARFGNPIYMPDNLQRLARALHNPATMHREIPQSWTLLCRAWDTWLGDMQSNASRLLKTDALWSGSNDPLKVALANFNANAKNLLPSVVVPEAAGEKRLGVLADSPPESVVNRLQLPGTQSAVDEAYKQVVRLATQLENWPRWEELRNLQAMLKLRAFDRAFAALQPRLPIKPGTTDYKLDTARTLKFFNDVSLDETGTLLLASNWRKITDLQTHMEAVPDRVQRRMPELILGRLRDRSSLGDFADSLADPLAEMSKYRREYIAPAVVVERFQNESALLKETADVTQADFPRWEKELVEFSKVPPTEDPRRTPTLDAGIAQLPPLATDLEDDAPAAEPGGLPTLSRADFRSELQQTTGELQALRAREIVRHDLPAVGAAITQVAGKISLLEQRLQTTLALLKPEIWLAKVAQPYGKFNETRARWAAWQATIANVTAPELSRDRNRFRALRANERQLRAWIDGLEGPDGIGALAVPELTGASADTAGALRQLESARREQTATAAAAAAEWRSALPVAPWSSASAAVRAPLEAHRQWLMDLPSFSVDLDRLNALLEGGFGWDEGVSETVTRLARHAGVDALTGRPAEWNAEAKLLGRLFGSNDRNELITAAQSGGLSRKFTAWRRLGSLTGWPAGAEDLDVDGRVVAALREILGREVKDETRRSTLSEELTKETHVRWNRAARNSASDETRLTAVFERMEKYGIGEADLDPPAAYDLKLWRFKRSDWSEVDLGPLRARRDAFVEAVRAIPTMAAQPVVADFVKKLLDIELAVNPNRAPTPSPRLAGWQEELTDDGLGLSATWKSGGKTVKLDFAIVQPVDNDNVLPFYLAKRAIAVGEFLDLVSTRPQEAGLMIAELPQYTRVDTTDTPRNRPLGWWPLIDNSGKYLGFELSPSWIVYTTAQVSGLLKDPDQRGQQPALVEAAAEKPTLRSPLQMVPPTAAKIFAEKLVGARLPTSAEWRATLKAMSATNQGIFRGANFQTLFSYLRDYKVAGQTTTWRPNEGIFLPLVQIPGAGRRKFADDGQPATAPRNDGRLWFTSVDEGPVTGKFLNLLGNVSVYLADGDQFYVVGGSALSPPGVDFTEPQKVEVGSLIGQKKVTEGFSDVGIRPAFDAPPGFRERYKLLVLVRQQKFLTW